MLLLDGAPLHLRWTLLINSDTTSLLRAYLFNYHAGIHYGGIESLFTDDIGLWPKMPLKIRLFELPS